MHDVCFDHPHDAQRRLFYHASGDSAMVFVRIASDCAADTQLLSGRSARRCGKARRRVRVIVVDAARDQPWDYSAAPPPRRADYALPLFIAAIPRLISAIAEATVQWRCRVRKAENARHARRVRADNAAMKLPLRCAAPTRPAFHFHRRPPSK